MVIGLFEDPLEVMKPEYHCGETSECIDPLDIVIPIEEAMIPAIMEMVLKDLVPAVYKPEDIVNDAKDGLSEIGLAQSNNNR